MIGSYGSSNSSFIADLNNIEARIATVNQQVSTGIRVSTAADDPSSVQPIVDIQASIAHVTQVQTNLSSVSDEVNTADTALQSSMNLMDRALTLATQNSSTGTTADSFSAAASEVTQIQQEMVGLANTNVSGRYIFGGDASLTAPYALDATAPDGVVAMSAASNTRVIEDANGDQLQPLPTAQEVFDSQDSSGAPASDNVFNALSTLIVALAANDPAAVAAAADNVRQAESRISSNLSTVGASENWISQASTAASAQLVTLQQHLSNVRDTDMASSISQLTLDQTAQQAAISADASLSHKSLFDYLG